VLAHPGRYRVAQSARDRLLGQFRDLGGSAIEVVSGSHAPEQVRDFARLARRFGLLASCGSDFHAPAESPVDLGRNRALPDGTAPLWRVLA
jgi:predicted metal-dependent phosphoesterase TrpH